MMDWLQTWAEIEVISAFVGLAIMALCFIAMLVYAVVVLVRENWYPRKRKKGKRK